AAIDDITSIRGSDLLIERGPDGPVISLAYEKRIPLAGPAGLAFDSAGRSARRSTPPDGPRRTPAAARPRVLESVAAAPGAHAPQLRTAAQRATRVPGRFRAQLRGRGAALSHLRGARRGRPVPRPGQPRAPAVALRDRPAPGAERRTAARRGRAQERRGASSLDPRRHPRGGG